MQHGQQVHNRLINEDEAASILGISARALQAWRVKGGGPIFRKIGRAVRYSTKDINDFIDRSAATSTAQVSGGRR